MKYLNLSKMLNIIISVAIYAFPFLEIYCFFNPFLRSVGVHIPMFEEGAYFLRENSWLNFLIFTVIIILTQSKKLNLSYFVRYNMMQSLIIIFMSSLIDTCGYLFPYFILAEGSIGYPIFNGCCFALLLLILYCVIFALRGKIPNIPLLTQSVRMQLWTE